MIILDVYYGFFMLQWLNYCELTTSTLVKYSQEIYKEVS